MNWSQISPYFRKEEILSPDTIAWPHLVDVTTLIKLNEFREFLDVPLLVNYGDHKRRGVRSAREQMILFQLGLTTANASMHCAGKAFDISSHSYAPKVLAEKARDYGWNFVKEYPWGVHVDNRTRWDV